MILPLRPRPLIVSQQLIIAADIYLRLTKLNCDVVDINITSNEALKAIEQKKPDVVLIDLSLKGSIDAIILGRMVIEKFDIPLIYLNPGMDRFTMNIAVFQNPEGFIHIPYEIDDLKRKIVNAIAIKSSPLQIQRAYG